MQKKVLILILIFSFICAISPQVLYAEAEQVIENDETGIPDKGLYQAILDALRKERNETFTKAEAESLTELDANGMEIFKREKVKSLKGIGYLANLTKLWVFANELTELTGLEYLRKLEDLNVDQNQLTNLSGIGKMNCLKILYAGENRLTNLNGIEHLNNLKKLYVGENQLMNLNGIEHLNNLMELSVGGNRLKALGELKELTGLTSLFIAGNQIKSLQDIAHLTNLEYLNVSGNSITSLSEVENMLNLKGLIANESKLKKLPNLKNHVKLEMQETWFKFNKILHSEWKKKLPKHLLKTRFWLNDQKMFQDVKKLLKIKKPLIRKVHSNTKTIIGKTQRYAHVYFLKKNGEVNKSVSKVVKADKNGVYKFKKLNLKRFAGKKIRLTAVLYSGYYDEEYTLKTIVIKVRKK